jgi:Polyketide cyclase / dehydrase and lipid transport
LEDAPREINRNAPATAHGELRIDADPQTVFAVILAIDQWPSWNPDVKSVELQGPVQPGTVFR